MGTDYYLFRLRAPLGRRRKVDEADFVPFGDAEMLRGRLAVLRDVPFDLGDEDPVTMISVHHAAPWDLLPIAEALADLAPFALFDPQKGRWHDPSVFAAKGPRKVASPFGAPKRGGPLGTRWTVRADEPFYRARLLPQADGVIAVHGKHLVALDGDGRARWSIEAGRGYLFAQLVHGVLVCGSEHPMLRGFDPASGAPVWSTAVDARVIAGPVAVGADAVAVGTGDGTVQVVSSRDGRPRWRASLDGQVMALASDGTWVVAGTNRGDLACLAAGDGTVAGRHVFPSVASTPKSRELQAVFAIELTDRALLRLARSIVPASLPELRVGPAVETGHPPVRDRLLVANADALAEAAMVRPGGFDPVTHTVQPHECAIRARELASLATRFELAAPFGAPAPVELAPGRWLAVLAGAAPGGYRLAVLDAATGAILDEAPGAAAAQSFALASRGGVAYVAAGDRLSALAISA